MTGESHVHTGLQPASTHYYWVKAISDASGTALGSSTPIGASGGSTGVGATTLQAVSGDIGSGAVDTTEIANEAVETNKVLDGAISKHPSEDVGLTNLTSSYAQVGQDLDIVTSGGEKVAVSYSLFAYENSAALDGRFEFYIEDDDGTRLIDAQEVVVSRAQSYGGTVIDNRTSAGTRTYKLFAREDLRQILLNYVYMQAVELKR